MIRKKRRNTKRSKASIIKIQLNKIFKLLINSPVSKIVTRKWIEVNDLSSGKYSVNKNIRFQTRRLRSDLYDHIDAHIVVKERMTVEGNALNKGANKKLIFKNNAPSRSCVSKINNIFMVNVEYLDIVMAMDNLLEYSENYSMTSGSL